MRSWGLTRKQAANGNEGGTLADPTVGKAGEGDVAQRGASRAEAKRILNVMQEEVHEDANESCGDRHEANHAIYGVFHGDDGLSVGGCYFRLQT